MKADSWSAKLDACKTEQQVLETARDYLASLDYFEATGLPAICGPRKLLSSSDVSSYAFDLVHYHCREEDAAASLIIRLAAFFAQANVRLSRILQKTNEEDVASEKRA